MTPNTAWLEHRVVKVTDFNYDENIINPSLSTISMVYPKVPEALNLGDQLVISTKMGNRVEVGEIKNIEKNLDNIVITVREPEAFPWQDHFIRMIGKPGQALFVFGKDEFNGRDPARRLCIDLSLATREQPIPILSPPPPPINANFHTPLDGDGDGTITEPEANDFAEIARRRIAKAGLTFAALAEKIPKGLKVNKLEVDGVNWGSRATQFNGVEAKVQLVGGTSFVYVRVKIIPGVSINSYRDVDRIGLEVVFRELHRVSGSEPRRHPIPSLKYPVEWPTPSQYISLIDKRSESMVVRGEKIASIRKVKRCGKCYYKIEIEDSGFVANIQTGYFRDCLLLFHEVVLFEELVDFG